MLSTFRFLKLLPKKHRLQKKKDFKQVFKTGWKFKEDFLSLRMVKNDLKGSRFGFMVSQKVSKKAVLRNKIKRRLRGLVKMNLLKIKKGMDIVLIAHPGLEKKDFWELEEILSKIFQKANLL